MTNRNHHFALVELFMEFGSELNVFLLRRGWHNQADRDDILSDGFGRLTRSAKLPTRANAVTATKSAAIDRLRREQKYVSGRQAEELLELLDAGPLDYPATSPEQAAINSERRGRLRQLVEQLPERERLAIESWIMGERIEELASKLGVSYPAARSLRRRAFKRLLSLALQIADQDDW